MYLLLSDRHATCSFVNNNNNNIIPTYNQTTTKAGQGSTLDVVKGPLHENTWLRSAT